jgi:uncharacterized cupin superfamily protein
MIVHLKRAEVALEPMPADDPTHTGDFRSYWKTPYRSTDGVVEVGFENLEGEIHSAAWEGIDEIVVVLDGTAEVEADGRTFRVEAGDVFVQIQPVTKTIRTSGLVMAYVIRYRNGAPA